MTVRVSKINAYYVLRPVAEVRAKKVTFYALLSGGEGLSCCKFNTYVVLEPNPGGTITWQAPTKAAIGSP